MREEAISLSTHRGADLLRGQLFSDAAQAHRDEDEVDQEEEGDVTHDEGVERRKEDSDELHDRSAAT